MLRRSGDSAADDGLHQGSSQGQSKHAAFSPTTSSVGFTCSTAPLTAPSNYAVAYNPQNTWTPRIGINRQYSNWSLSTVNSFLASGSAPHLDSLKKTQASRSRSFSSTNPGYQQHYQLLNYVDPNHHLTPPITHFQSQPYDLRIDLRSNTTPIPVYYDDCGMHPFSQDIPPPDSIPAENEDSSATSKKRHRDIFIQDDSNTVDQMERPPKQLRTSSSPHTPIANRFLLTQDDRVGSDQQGIKHGHIDNTPTSPDALERDQKTFIQQWVDFVMSRSQANFPNESLNALATLTQARPQLVFDYIRDIYPSIEETNQFPLKQQPSPHSFSPTDSRQPYSLGAANAHLPPSTLVLVTKYITSCRRTRPRNDGRRSVNEGHYRCLHGCGYHTRRAFDWRRHEETHEPQELWLCTLCSQKETQRGDDLDTDTAKKEPFMVSRKDKFLRHARECHKDWTPEKVLDLSRLDYKPSEELKCPKCASKCKTWDERCRHMLGHFDQEEEERKRESGRDMLDASKGSVEGSVVSHSESVVSEISDDDGFK